jgi:hypothetical protein
VEETVAWFVFFTIFYLGDQTKKYEIRGAGGAYREWERCICCIGGEN